MVGVVYICRCGGNTLPAKHLVSRNWWNSQKDVLSRAAVLAANALAYMPSPAFGETRTKWVLRESREFRLTWQSRGSALIKFFTAYHPCISGNVPPTCLHDKTNYSNHYPDHPPLMVKGLKFEISDIRLYEIDFVDWLFQLSLRGKRDFRLTWQSRGSALANKVAFQRIATAPDVHV